MSFSISEELKKIIKSLVEHKKSFKNQSGFVRTALNHYLNSSEAQIDLDDSVDANQYKVSGQVVVSFKKGEQENRILKDVFRCEAKYSDSVTHFQLISTDKDASTCIYSFFGNVFDFRSFVDDLDSVSDIEQLRYIINE
ncbi:MAG: ribbon-helix-helix domain-containing protein [Promethearchaeota archaeon]